MPQKIIDHLLKCNSVALFVHVNPDWDCIGSAFALRGILRAKGIKADVFTEEALSPYLGFMESDVIAYSERSEVPDYECYCAVDVGSVDRMGEWGKFFTQKDNTVCIDHHHQSSSFAALSYVEPSRSATGEMVYELIALTDIPLTKEIASYLYCAISADTGSFQYASVNRRTYEIVIALTDTGINTTHLCSMLYERNTLTQLRLQAEAINSIRLYAGGAIATACITDELMKKYSASKSDTDALAQIPRSIDGVVISAFLKEQEDGSIRISLRALGDFNIEPVARLFGGGGHKKAAGCTISGMSIEDAQSALVGELSKVLKGACE